MITIVVLLILAGVSLNLLIGRNVIVDSKNAKYVAENGILHTKVGKEVITCYSKDRNINIQEGILSLNSCSFYQAENAENIILPEGVETIRILCF